MIDCFVEICNMARIKKLTISQYLKGRKKYRYPKKITHDNSIHIVLNGPSLNYSYKLISQLPGDVMMVNESVRTELFDTLSPSYYMFLDGDDIELLEEIVYLLAKKGYKKELILGSDLIGKCNIDNFLGNVEYINKDTLLYHSDKTNLKFYQKNIISPGCHTVGIMALYLSIQMGYKKIYLHGNDLSFYTKSKVDENNILWVNYPHYYDETCLVQATGNVYESFKYFTDMIGRYMTIKRYADSEEVIIYNMSKESYLDMFEKYKY